MSKELIEAWQSIADRWPKYTNDISDLIASEKRLLNNYAKELQQCII
jgi:hypothetical protein